MAWHAHTHTHWPRACSLKPWEKKVAELPSEYKPVWHDIPTAYKDQSIAPSVPTSTAQAAAEAHSSHPCTGVSVAMGCAQKPLPPPQRLGLYKVKELIVALRLVNLDTTGVKKTLQRRLYEHLSGTGKLEDLMVDMAALSATASSEFAEMDGIWAQRNTWRMPHEPNHKAPAWPHHPNIYVISGIR